MIKRICTICARSGSKGVKNKNTRELLGKPLIAHSILQALSSNMFDIVAVSSDSESILSIGRDYGVHYCIKRPAELATDHAAKLPAIKHCVREVEYLSGHTFDTIVDLDATSPLRSVGDIRSAIELLETRGVSNVITGTPARRSPYFNLVELDRKGFVRLCKPLSEPIVRRQDSPQCYDMNASIYVWNRKAFFAAEKVFYDDTLLYIMPPERSLDIDSELDFLLVEYLARFRSDLVDYGL